MIRYYFSVYRNNGHLLVLLMICFLGNNTAEGISGDRSGMHFLRIGVGGRAGAMGEAFSTAGRGAEALYWNPAGALFTNKREVILSHSEWIQDIRGEFVGFSWRSGGHAWGYHLYSHNISGIEYRTKPSVKPLGVFGAHDLSTGITFSKSIGKEGAVGITAKYLYEKIFVEESNGWAIDGGVLLPLPVQNLMFAVVARNWGSMNEMKDESITLPSSVRIGLGYVPQLDISKLGNFSFTADYESIKGARDLGMVGIEWRVFSQMQLRGGYQMGYSTRSVCGGIGFIMKQVWFDYGYAPFGENLGNTHRISLGLQW